MPELGRPPQLVPMTPPGGSCLKVRPLREMSTSDGVSRSGTAPMASPAGISAGMSFML